MRHSKFQFFFAMFLAISKKVERACMMYVQSYVSHKNTLFFILIFYLEGLQAAVESLLIA